ncbi:tRNA (N(6)-L-threonylcarbamoyladenosine(37)-C(2))-methylthiotransferase MtaB [Crassaminicella profunda]|uniref:tRNA (N(6)-L-threonylcarbamoyladenosine(37)-C(2))- methylthiotransferase MtaB n=1 Tax=Crassaminicella profunda TaxID=1286698 RepID=UPI001CA6B67F|nr:tRNA (N(6)-L-threonylcarbamoyladenosine(37)-C(2))-methylthiotransferase MtaB [Crassaminicella profunda]QZY56544.1 tRNA (N(6)-L-threonylcarbamoyladenosine(37)-C(2))-methylthiotransferase MtaB [Crassaminicella profunda]
MKKVAFYTLGCKVNQYETEAMGELFEKAGYGIVDSGEHADVYVINTCTVTNLGDRKSRQFIRRAKRKNPKAIIAVVGCYSQTSPEEVSAIEGVNIVLGTNHRKNIVEYVENIQEENEKINVVENIMEIQEFEEMTIGEIKGKTRAYLKIQEGCNQYCTYCIIPYARGQIRSRRLEDIVKEVQRLAKNHFKEIVLTGIHVASYGKDFENTSLLDVIRSVHEVEGIERIRLSSIEPTIMTEDFVKTLANLKKVCPHFHLSLQSGCDETLKRMNRKYTTTEYKMIVERIRKYIKDVSITTDIMVGFPGETEEEFEKTMQFVEEIGFGQIHVFKYSKRKGTPAAKFENQVPSQIKNIRSERLIDLARKSLINYHEKFMNTPKMVLFETTSNEKEDHYEGLTDNYIRVLCQSNENLEGKILKVTLEKISGEVVIGKIVNQ